MFQEMIFTTEYFNEVLNVAIRGFFIIEAISISFKLLYHYLQEKINKKLRGRDNVKEIEKKD